jgi:hypothetical protein
LRHKKSLLIQVQGSGADAHSCCYGVHSNTK